MKGNGSGWWERRGGQIVLLDPWFQASGPDDEFVPELEEETRTDLGAAGEEKMRQALRALGWRVMKIPGHQTDDPGPDAIAWRGTVGPDGKVKDVEVLLPDNKNFTARSKVSVAGAAALSAEHLSKSLEALRPVLALALGRSKDPVIKEVYKLLAQTREAAKKAHNQPKPKNGIAVRDPKTGKVRLEPKIDLPTGVSLIITNAGDGPGGKVNGITSTVDKLGIKFQDLNTEAIRSAMDRRAKAHLMRQRVQARRAQLPQRMASATVSRGTSPSGRKVSGIPGQQKASTAVRRTPRTSRIR